MPTREEEFSRVRELLGFPRMQKPSPHQIFAELIRQEQRQRNRLQLSGRPWNIAPATTTITSVVGQAEYLLSPTDFSKAWNVFRIVGDQTILPVPFTDFHAEPNNQSYDFWVAPVNTPAPHRYESGEKIAFFRTSTGQRKARLFPIPEEAGRVYQIVYAPGALDDGDMTISDTPILPEWSDHRCLQAALFQLPHAEWEGYTRPEQSARRQELQLSLTGQLAMVEPLFAEWIRNPQEEPISDVGYWYQ